MASVEIRSQIDNEAHKNLVWIGAGSAATLFAFFKDVYKNDPELSKYLLGAIVVFIINVVSSLILFRLRREVSLKFETAHPKKWIWSNSVWYYWYGLIAQLIVGYSIVLLGMMSALVKA